MKQALVLSALLALTCYAGAITYKVTLTVYHPVPAQWLGLVQGEQAAAADS